MTFLLNRHVTKFHLRHYTIYNFIHIFHYFCESKTLLNQFQAPKQFVHMSKNVFTSDEEFLISFNFSSLGSNYLSIQCSRPNGGLIIEGAEIVLNSLIWNRWVSYASAFKGEYKKICKSQGNALGLQRILTPLAWCW